jgi:release factor-specific protein-(glutamine-N5) methyltransferase
MNPERSAKMPDTKTNHDWLKAARQQIDALDARLLLQHVTGFSHADLICRPDAPLNETTTKFLNALLKRRAAGEPLAYLLGCADFYGRRFQVTPAVLTPRPETEELVDLALTRLTKLTPGHAFFFRGRRGGISSPLSDGRREGGGRSVVDAAWLSQRALRQRQTPAEQVLWRALRGKRFSGFRFRRQQALGPYIVDFVCFASRLIIELDGEQHATARAYDIRRDAWLKQRRFRVLRFRNNACLTQTEDVLESIWKVLQDAAQGGEKCRRILDLGTGSGIIAISLALECPDAQVTACDISPAALAVARANAEHLRARVRFLESDWFSGLAGECFHLIVANPPYIAAGDTHLADDGLRFEPRQALTDEADGLAAIRAIIAAAPTHLYPGGWLLFEHGWNQGEASRALLAAAGLAHVQTWRDLSGQERISGGQTSSRAAFPLRPCPENAQQTAGRFYIRASNARLTRSPSDSIGIQNRKFA